MQQVLAVVALAPASAGAEAGAVVADAQACVPRTRDSARAEAAAGPHGAAGCRGRGVQHLALAAHVAAAAEPDAALRALFLRQVPARNIVQNQAGPALAAVGSSDESVAAAAVAEIVIVVTDSAGRVTLGSIYASWLHSSDVQNLLRLAFMAGVVKHDPRSVTLCLCRLQRRECH